MNTRSRESNLNVITNCWLVYDIYVYTVAHKDLAGNVFASMDEDLVESSEEKEVEKAESRHRSAENDSVGYSDDRASNVSEDVDEALADEDIIDADCPEVDVKHETDDADINSGSGGNDESDGASVTGDDDDGDNASHISG